MKTLVLLGWFILFQHPWMGYTVRGMIGEFSTQEACESFRSLLEATAQEDETKIVTRCIEHKSA